MIGEINHPDPTVDIPPWTYPDDQTADMHYYNTLSPNANANSCLNFTDDYALKAFQRYLPSNNNVTELDYEDFDVPMDMYTCDNFRIYEFKIRKCARGKSHDWTECPYAHPCEKARRRDPRKYHYSGIACPDFRKGNICKKGDGCEFAHGVFECWLHPSRYRTQPCKDGPHCKRKVCFFAHSPEQLRVLSPRTDSSSYDGSPRGGVQFGSVGYFSKSSYLTSSPDSGSPPTESPPMSPMTGSPLSRSLGSSSVNEILASLRQLQLNKVKSMPCSSWNNNIHIGCSSGLGSPRLPVTRSGFISLPSTPTQVVNRSGLCFDQWDKTVCEEEEPVMERVESGKGLRAKMFQKLSKENPLDGPDLNPNPYQFEDPNPDVDWVSDLIQ